MGNQSKQTAALVGLLSANAAVGVNDLDVELSSALEDVNAVLRRHVVRDLSGVGAVVHQENLELLNNNSRTKVKK